VDITDHPDRKGSK